MSRSSYLNKNNQYRRPNRKQRGKRKKKPTGKNLNEINVFVEHIFCMPKTYHLILVYLHLSSVIAPDAFYLLCNIALLFVPHFFTLNQKYGKRFAILFIVPSLVRYIFLLRRLWHKVKTTNKKR